MTRTARPIVAALAVLLLHATPGFAQGAAEREGVRRAVLDYVEGFYEGDTAKLERGVSTDVQKYGFWIPDDSAEYEGGTMPWPELLEYAREFKESGQPTPSDAPKEIEIFDVLDQTASAKLTAWWGTDYLLLAKINGRWMIRMVLWQTPASDADH